MPFTLSHAVAAWPLRRTRLEFSALLIGCFVPDFPYFLLMWVHGFAGHTIPGMFYFDLPLGLGSLWLFHSFVKQPALVFLPNGLRSRLKIDSDSFSFLPPSRLAWIALSILVGSATHILWDAFTHPMYWPYHHWSFLRLSVHLPVVGYIVMDKLLQYLSSVAGLAVVAIWIWRWYRTTEPLEHPVMKPYSKNQRRTIRAILPTIAICGGFLRAYSLAGTPHGLRPGAYFMLYAGVTAIAIFILGLLAGGMLLARHKSKHSRA